MLQLSRLVAALLTVVLMLAVSPVTPAAFPREPICQGQATPNDAFVAVTTAVAKNDWRKAYSFIAREARSTFFKELVTGMLVVWALDQDKTRAKDFEQVLRSNGFKLDASGRLLDSDKYPFEAVTDWPKLMQDIAPFFKHWSGRSISENDSKLTGVRIEGQHASATILTRNGSRSQRMSRFIKGRSGWCMLKPQ